jgi:hypothetical protein
VAFADGAAVPERLDTPEFVLRPITVEDAALDYEAVVETREQLRRWEQSTWPADDFTIEANRRDLADLERRHREHRAYTYTVVSPDGTRCLGCVYVFPTDATFLTRARVTPIGQDAWADVDAVVYFWMRLSCMRVEMDVRLLSALRTWFREQWGLERTVYVTNEQFTQQVELIRRTDLRLAFHLVEPGKPGIYLVFA